MSVRSHPVMVLGMHRSGTSCLAGCLQAAGLNLGDANTQASFNKRGNRENFDFVHIHDRVLARVGAAWDDPPENDPVWPTLERRVRDAAIRKLQTETDEGRWGLKDPRALLVLNGWLDLSPTFVGTFRHPVAVVRSLRHRAEQWGRPMSEDAALSLWTRYNRALLDVHSRKSFPVIRYDQPEDGYRDDLAAIAGSLGLDAGGGQSFRTPELHNQTASDAALPDGAQTLFERLLALPRPRDGGVS
ncbi:MAG: sulfotransferase [Litorimonas sp.]